VTKANSDRLYKSIQEYPMYKYLALFSAQPSAGVYSAKEFGTSRPSGLHDDSKLDEKLPQKPFWRHNYDNLTDGERSAMLVDEIFALYLWKTSTRVNSEFYKIVLAYAILFRECLNDLGWSKKFESENIKIDDEPELKERSEKEQFCLTNNAEHAPEICNEFVTVFMEHKRNS